MDTPLPPKYLEMGFKNFFFLTTSELLFSNIDYNCASREFHHYIIAFFISFLA